MPFIATNYRDAFKFHKETKPMSLKDAESYAAKPKITENDIDLHIASVWYLNGFDAAIDKMKREDAANQGMKTARYVPWELQVITICLLTLRNGFTIVGKSACAHPDNYDQKIGEKIALRDARAQMWPLLGYNLRERLFAQSRAGVVEAAAAKAFNNAFSPMDLTADMEVKGPVDHELEKAFRVIEDRIRAKMT